MLDFLLNENAGIRLSVFIAVFAVFALMEGLAPRRKSVYSKSVRWINNLTISLVNVIAVRLIIPATLVFVAVEAKAADFGFLNLVDMPMLVKIFVAFLLLDFSIYIQHIIFHKVGFLWRLHRMHHADLDFDLTTGIRFHPFEIILSLAIKMVAVLIIGAPYISVLIFEIVLNATSLFNHANIRVPLHIEKYLRLFLVTPDMHRVHHSTVKEETNSNFGFNLPWWDYLFKTYTSQPQAGHEDMKIGIESFRSSRELWLDRLLLQPFRKAD